MNFESLIENINPTIYAGLQRAIEIGKWPDGRPLTPEQREHCMTAVIAYDLKKQPETERVGFIDRGSKAEGEMCDDEPDPSTPQALKWAE